jgi:predicted transcriptional regulator
MVDPFEEISFLTRSKNRVDVLGALSDQTHTRRELVEETGISTVTIGRVIQAFTERGWVREHEGVYRVSAVGELLATDYRRLEESMNIAARLGPVLHLLPVDEMDFDLRLFADARISDPEYFDSLKAIDRWKQLLREADRIVGTAPAPTAVTVVADPFHQAIVAGNLEFSVVVSPAYYDAARAQPEMRGLLREILQAGGEMYVASGEEEEFTAHVALFDDLATLTGYDPSGDLRVGIESFAEPVRKWVQATYESYREDASLLTPDDFTE